MEKIRILFLIIIVGAGIAITIGLFHYQPKTPLESSLAPAYQLFGHATKGVSRALTVIMRVDDMDEKKYGEAIAERYEPYNDSKDNDYIYVNSVMKTISENKRKPFDYRVFIYPDDSPNAFALPGGVILVTRGLFDALHSQAELSAVLAHEMGHVEMSHCLDAVRFELAAKKIDAKPLGEIADMTMSIFLRHSFSKTQEDDADNYAFEILKISQYDPSAEGKVYNEFIAWQKKHNEETRQKADVVRDYFLSHPPLEIRAVKFTEKAKLWWEDNPNERRYIGVRNLKEREAAFFDKEWKVSRMR
jgi:beta-barrel assembly-enhancing protease